MKPGAKVGNSCRVTEFPYLMPAAVRASVIYQWPQSFRCKICSSVLQLRFHIWLPVVVRGSGLKSLCIPAVRPHGCALEQRAGRHTICTPLWIAAGRLFLGARWVCWPQWDAPCSVSNASFNSLPWFYHLGSKRDGYFMYIFALRLPKISADKPFIYHTLRFITNNKSRLL